MPSGVSAYLPPEFVEQVRATVDAEAVFTEHVRDLRGRGAERTGCCPFHENTDTGAFGANIASGQWLCRNSSCGAHGDVFAFYMRVRGLDFPGAVRELAQRAGVPLPVQPDTGPANEHAPISEAEVERWHRVLLDSRAYVDFLARKRGLTLDTVRAYQLGHDGDRFTIPVRDLEGRCVNIRRYRVGGNPKMLSWREGYGSTRLYPACALEQSGSVVVVESELDALVCRQVGLNAVSSTGGAGSWPEHFTRWFAGRHVVLFYDNDLPGQRGAEKVARALHSSAASIRVVQYPDGTEPETDATDLLVRDAWTGDQLRALVDAAQRWEPEAEPAPAAARTTSTKASATTGTGSGEKEKKPPKVPDSTILLGLVNGEGVALWHTREGVPFATFPRDDHREHAPIRSATFKGWLRLLWHHERGGAPLPAAVEQVQSLLESKALLLGEEHVVAVRVGQADGKVYYDLGDRSWRAVEVDADGWRIVSNPPVRFVRPKGTAVLPDPQPGGSLQQLRDLLHLGDDAWVLLVAFLVGALRPSGPYPILDLLGQQGSGKSTLARWIRQLVDPRYPVHSDKPRDPQDLAIEANNGWLVSYDNLSGLPDWLSDSLCRLCTGGGFRTRELYSDDSERLFYSVRPILLNGISEILCRPDLASRSIVVNMPPAPEPRRPEAEIDAEFDAALPFIAGALLDAVACAVRNLPHTRLVSPPRLADFATWVQAAEPALPWEPGAFLAAFADSQEGARAAALESDTLSGPVAAFARQSRRWTGSATELLAELNTLLPAGERPTWWPGNAKVLSDRLRRLAPDLRQHAHVAVQHWQATTRDRSRFITLEYVGDASPEEPTEVPF